jgi:GNAT superfamily N-acetyltransferase
VAASSPATEPGREQNGHKRIAKSDTATLTAPTTASTRYTSSSRFPRRPSALALTTAQTSRHPALTRSSATEPMLTSTTDARNEAESPVSSVQIREAIPSEYADLDKLAVEAWQVLRSGYWPDQWDGLIAAIEGRMSEIADSGKVLVAVDGSEIHGAVGYVPAESSNPKIFPADWPSMRMLVVAPARRGMGTGRRLANACIQKAKDDGATCIGLHTSGIMSVALPMYLRMGFVKDTDLPPIAGAPYARYVLRF